jgi:hypothetical protein
LAQISRTGGKLGVKVLSTSSELSVSGINIDYAIRDILAADFDRIQSKTK